MLTLKKLALAVLLVFAPIKTALLTTAALVVLDFVLGVAAALKKKEPITSNRMRDTAGKILAYELTIIIGFLVQHYLAPDVPFVNIASTYVAVTEGTSCLENLGSLTGQDLLAALISKLNSFK